MKTTKETPHGRGCGERTEDVPYLCSSQSLYGLPVEAFIIDPVEKWDLKGHSRGYTLYKNNGINHIVIFVGKQYYPSPWDFVEEVKHFGVSRRIPENFPFDKLTPGKSNMYFAHSRAIPTFHYTPVHHSKYCDELKTTMKGWHTENKSVSLPPCTYSLRDLSVFHNKHERIGDKYLIRHKSYGYDVNPPIMAKIQNEWNYINEPIHSVYNISNPLYNQKKLHTAPITYTPEYGIFMYAPITHVEGKNSLPVDVLKKINQAGIEGIILDY